MKKLLVTFFIFAMTSTAAVAWERAAGISISLMGVDTTVTDDIDNNGGTPDTTKDITNDIGVPSLFIEGTNEGDKGSLTVGVDWIPMSAELDSRSTTQSSLKAASDGAASSGTNRGTVDISKHITVYLQPGYRVDDDTTIFATIGYVTSDVETDVQSVSSTNKVVEDTLDGTKLGVGVKRNTNMGFVKLEYSQTDYDPISVVTSNNTKVTGDIDTNTITLSFGKKF